MSYNVVQDYSRGDAVDVLIPGWFDVNEQEIIQMPMPAETPEFKKSPEKADVTACIAMSANKYDRKKMKLEDCVDRLVTCSNRGFFKVNLLREAEEELTTDNINNLVVIYYSCYLKYFVLVLDDEKMALKNDYELCYGSVAGRIVKITDDNEPIVEFFKYPFGLDL